MQSVRRLLLGIFICIACVFTHKQAYSNPPAEKMIDIIYAPGSSSVIVKMLVMGSPITKIQIANLIGRSVREKGYVNTDDKVVISDINDLPNGIYIILAKDKAGKILDSAKFILNHQ